MAFKYQFGGGLTEENSILLKKSNLTKDYSKTSIVNFCFALGFPELLKEYKKENSSLLQLANINKRKFDRDLILKIRKEEKTKYYFLSRFVKDWRLLLSRPYPNDKIKKQRLLKILNTWIGESKTYTNNNSITHSLEKYKNGLEKTNIPINELKDLFELTLKRLDDKEDLNVYKKNTEKVKND